MSSDESSNATSDRRDAVREKAQQVQARQKRTHRIRTATIAASVVAVVAVAAVVVTWAVSSAASKPMLSPSNSTHDGFAVTVADSTLPDPTAVANTSQTADAPEPDPSATTSAAERPAVDIRVYVDYLSSGARDWQLANVQQLSTWVNEGAATLTYHPVSMLAAKSNGTKYSLRAASAAACMAWALANC